MLKIFKDKSLFKHLLISGFFLVLLFVVWLKYLDFYTNHNDVIKVPDFHGVFIEDLDSVLDSYSLRYEIIDSVFDRLKQRGIVINQDPLTNTNVKRNRKIYLTINSIKARMVIFPDVFDLTLRQAVRKLEKNGFGIGKLEYRADIATNMVLAYKVNGISIEIGQELYYGTIIDLVVAQGLSNEKVMIPNLIGLSRIEANIILKSTSLNIGLEYFKDAVSDSNSAVIYKQYPQAIDDNTICIGSSLDLYFDVPKIDFL